MCLRTRDRKKHRNYVSKRGAIGQEAVNFRLTHALYVSFTYVTAARVCVFVRANWTLDLHYFPNSQKSPITISVFTAVKQQQGLKKKWRKRARERKKPLDNTEVKKTGIKLV